MTAHRVARSSFVAVVALLLAACSDSKQLEVLDTSTSAAATDTAVETSTTVGDTVPPPSTAPASTAATTTAPPTTVPAPTTTSAPPPGGLTALGSTTWLVPTPGAGITLPAAFTCDGIDPGIPGWTLQDCQQMPSYSDGVTTLVLRRNDDGRFGLAVLFRSGSSLVQRYFAAEEGPGTWSAVTVQLGDFHFDDGAEVWVGYRSAGTGGYLDIDVLDPLPGGVFFLGGLQGLAKGGADLHPGGATVISAVYEAGDPTCCPTSFLVQEISFAAGQWRIDAGTEYPATSAPTVVSDL